MRRVLLATRSTGKLAELRAMLAAADFSVIDLSEAGIPEAAHEEAIEAFETFEDNARAKARHFFSLAGIPTIADDSGLAVDSLGGRPGVRSKRFSGRRDLQGQALDDANNQLLQRELAGHTDRRARYVCAVAYVDDDREVITRGECEGEILPDPRGSAGFGYDPYFYSRELGATFAEVPAEVKARVSHRARAFAALRAILGDGR